MSRLAASIGIAAVAAAGFAMPASAGECPPDKEIAASMNGDGHMKSEGVEDVVLASSRLGDHYSDLAGFDQRVRMLTVQPGGEVAWHSHADRPAMIYITEGEITEYRSTCVDPIEHKAGEVAAETGNLEHWWRNNTDHVARLISVDIPRSQ